MGRKVAGVIYRFPKGEKNLRNSDKGQRFLEKAKKNEKLKWKTGDFLDLPSCPCVSFQEEENSESECKLDMNRLSLESEAVKPKIWWQILLLFILG